MNFNKIDIVGFKSFADRLEINFNVGVTGIVGPNGCGKSNVADAIRWVLGEQSARILRGSSMQDVIFSGTQNRKALSYCEVSLHFDNSSRMFSLDYNEVVITRKLYRSGESEYYINRQIARLKDIVNLLHEVGIGKEGYSIIGQGKVDELLSSKPEERRAIFEEATGISKFKGTKADIERRLARTKDNLVRYLDILNELELRIGPLKKQSEEAIRYKDLSEKIKYQEINHFIFKAENVGAERAKVQARIDEIDGQIREQDEEQSAAQARYERVGTEIILNDAAVQKVNEDILRNSVENEKRLGDVKVYGERINACRTEIDRLKGEIESDTIKLNRVNQQIVEKTEEKEEKTRALAELDRKAEQEKAELVTLIRQISAAEGVSEENRKKMMENIQSLSDVKVAVASLDAKKSLLSSRQQEVVEKVETLKTLMRNAEIEGLKYQNLAAELKQKNEDLDKVIAEKQTQSYLLAEKVKEYNAKLITLNSQLASHLAKQNFLKEMKTSYEGFGESVKFLMRGAESDRSLSTKIRGVVAKVIKTDKMYVTAMETALGGSMQSVIVDTPEDAKPLIAYLKSKGGGRVTFLPISSVRARFESESIKRALREQGALGLATDLVKCDAMFDGIIRNLLGNTLVVDQIDNAIAISKKYASAFKIVTLEGEIFTTQGAITGGSANRNIHLLGGDKQIAAVEGDIERAKEQLAKGERMVEEFKQRQEKMAEEMDAIRLNITKNEQDMLVYGEKAMAFAAEYQRLSSELSAYDAEVAAIESTLSSIAEEQTRATSVKAFEEMSEEEQARFAAEFDKMKQRRDELADLTTRREIERNALLSALGVISSDIMRLSTQVQELTAAIAATKETLAMNERIFAQLAEAASKVALSEEEQNVVTEMKNHLAELEEQKSALLREQVEIDKKKQEIHEAVLALQSKRAEEEIAMAKISSDLEHLASNIKEDYDLDFDACMELKDENFDDYGSLAETARLKRERGAIKNVNLNAEADYAEVKERYEEMQTQKDDIQDAQDDLEQALKKLTDEMVTTFNAGFKEINENFQYTFKELLGGGNAMLELEEVEEGKDPLSAGVEIKAEPPGKKLQKLSLLSGGERALTAIAILFAILRMRPMPFCVLDEIEAALDEANVDRFARYLKNFSEKTQFIVITHRKPTMEMADALYGVTMEEKGVSKMVSVKLADLDDSVIEPQKILD